MFYKDIWGNKRFLRGFLLGISPMLICLLVYPMILVYKTLPSETFWSFILTLITIIGWIVSYLLNNILHKRQLQRTTKIELYKKLTFDLVSNYKKTSRNYNDGISSFEFISSFCRNQDGTLRDENQWNKYIKGINDYYWGFDTAYNQIVNLLKNWSLINSKFNDTINTLDGYWQQLSAKQEHFRRNISWPPEEQYKEIEPSTIKLKKEIINLHDTFSQNFDILLGAIEKYLLDEIDSFD